MEDSKRFLGLQRNRGMVWHGGKREDNPVVHASSEVELFDAEAEVMGKLKDLKTVGLLFKLEGVSNKKYTIPQSTKKPHLIRPDNLE